MWNLFSNVQPKVIKPARSLKQQLLYHEAKALSSIQAQARQILNSINNILKPNHIYTTQSNQLSDSQFTQEIQSNINSLYSRIQCDNTRFDSYITFKYQQKENQQQFFKNTMKAYEFKKYQLNKHIEQLQAKVQSLQLKGFKTYQQNPKINNVLNGINQNYIDKYMIKLQESSKIQQNIQTLVLKNRQRKIKEKAPASTTQFNFQKQEGTQFIVGPNKCNSLSDLEKQLQLIFLKEEIIGGILDNKIKNCKRHFQKYACQEKSFKQSLKKIGSSNEQRRRSSTKLVNSKSSSQKFVFGNQKLKNTSNFIENKNQKILKSLNPSIDNEEIQINSKKQELSQFNEQIRFQQENEQSDEGMPSQKFIEACQFLITERFVDEDQQKTKEEGQQQIYQNI